jgi:exopolysaccharide biosynthesis polyprenyl glycosylphosphotransferase
MAFLYLLDLGSSLLALFIAQHLRLLPISTPITPVGVEAPAFVRILVVGVFAIILPATGLYDARRVTRAFAEAELVLLGVTLSGVILAGTLYLTYRELPRLMFIYLLAVAPMLLLGHRLVLRLLYQALRWGTQAPVAVIVGGGPLGSQAAKILASAGVRIAGFIDNGAKTQCEGYPVLAGLDGLPSVVEQKAVTDIVLALPLQAEEHLAHLLVSLWKLSLRIYMVPDFFSLGFSRIRVEHLGGLTMLGLREPVIDGFQRVAKRLLDLALGSMILVVALPVMGMIAVAIRLDSPGPVMFRQRRVGENGRLFVMFKFRTMVASAEHAQEVMNTHTASGQVIHKRRDDPRVTRVGRVLRRLSLDELPQLLNVLRGEMSLVGPRPELPWIVARYDPWQYQRLAVPQGMTSWYVVNGRSETPMHLNTEEDLRYVRNCSFFEDLKILWKSMGAVLRGRGAF